MSVPLRIERSQIVKASAASQPGDAAKEYLGKLLRMVPGEAQSLFVLGQNVIKKENHSELLGWAGFCLIVVIVVRIMGTRDPTEGKTTDWLHVVFSSMAFLLWLYSLGVFFSTFSQAHAEVSILLTAAFTFLVPYFYKGKLAE
jgi:hypothetical protein